MKQIFIFAAFFLGSNVFAAPETPLNPVIAPGTLAATSATLVWDKPEHYSDIVQYRLFLNGKEVGISTKCNYRFTELKPLSKYKLSVKAEDKSGKLSPATSPVKFITLKQGKTLNVIDFGAKGDSVTLNTKAIQSAIDACPEYGTVLIFYNVNFNACKKENVGKDDKFSAKKWNPIQTGISGAVTLTPMINK
jgi:hypothetical protein